MILDHAQPTLWWLDDIWPFLMLSLLRPLLEEMVFRGLLQGWCMQKPWGAKQFLGLTHANWLVSLIFSAMHLFAHAPLMAMLVMIPSLIFGHFRDRYCGNLTAAVLLHCFYNGGYFSIYPPF